MARVKAKSQKIVLDNYGSYLGMEKGCLIVKAKNGKITEYPMFETEIGEVIARSGNMISTGALASMGFWGIDCLVLTRKGRPVAMLKALDDDSHVKTRVAQYEAFNNDKAFQIAKHFVLGKLEGQNRLLEKYGLETHSSTLKEAVENIESKNLSVVRRRLLTIEARYSRDYFGQVFGLFPEKLKPKARSTFKAYDGVNNIFNLAYEMLSWKVHRALVKAKLEPYLGFLHSLQHGKPSLICDFMELYRHLIDDFVIQQCRGYNRKDFTLKRERFSHVSGKVGKRQYLNDLKTRDFMRRLNLYFERTVEVPRIRIGKRQTVETLINEEALLLAKYLRDERKTWIPRIAIP